MELAYLKKLYQDGLFDVYSGFDTWEEAVKAACSPLIRQGLVEPAYADSIIENVAENGPYIFIAPHICMPHSKRTDLVRQATVSFVKINRPVYYDESDPEMGAELFFAIAVKELELQGLTEARGDYMEPHAYSIMEHISDETVRNLHVMEG